MAELLLDTNAVITLFSEDEILISYLEDKDILVPVIAIGELLYGAENSKRRAENIHLVNQFARNREILNCTSETATWYGRIMKKLRAKGRPIPQNDVWIAAIAMQYDLVLLTKDKHFDNVDDLKMQDW